MLQNSIVEEGDRMDLEKMRVILEMDKGNYSKKLADARRETEQATKKIEEETRKVKQSSKSLGGDFSATQTDVQRTMQNIRGALSLPLRAIQSLREKLANVTPGTVRTDEYSDLQAAIENTEAKISSLKKEQMELIANGRDMTLTAEYKEMADSVSKAEKKLNALLDREERFKATGGKTSTTTYKRLQYDIEEARNTLGAYKAVLGDIEETGIVYEHSVEWKKVQAKIDEAKQSLREFNTEKSKMEMGGSAYTTNSTGLFAAKNAAGTGGKLSKVFAGMKKVLGSVAGGIKKVSGAFGSLINRFKNAIPIFNKTSKSAAGMTGQMKGLAGLLRTIGMTAKFMFASFLIMGTMNGIKEGLQNLAQYSEKTNASLSLLMSSLTQLKNALATAFAPILNVVTPLLNALIQKVTQAVSAFGMLFASLTGQSYFTKAKKINQDYADSLNQNASSADKANKANKKLISTLLGFDQINKLDDESDNDSGDTSGGLSPSDMFDEIPIASKIRELADKIRTAWASADFTDIGRMLGEKLNNALKKIPWKKIRATANKIAKSIATLLNGFLESVKWEVVGNTIAQGINTAFEFVNTFAHNFHWNSLGVAIGDLINGACKGLDWNLIHGTLKDTVKGIISSINSFLETADFTVIGNTFGNIIQSFILIGYTWVTEFPWAKFGLKIADGLNGALDKIDIPMLGASLGRLISGIFSTVKNLAGNIKWTELGEKIATGINNMFKALDSTSVAEGINNVVNGIYDMLGEILQSVDWGNAFGKVIEIWNKLDWKVKLAGFALTFGKAIFGVIGIAVQNSSLLTGLTEAFGGSIAAALGGVGTFLSGAAGIGAIGFNIYDVFSGMRESIRNKDLFGIVDSIKGFCSLSDIPDSMNAGIQKALRSVGFKNPIAEKFTDCKEWLISKGRDIISGLINGMSENQILLTSAASKIPDLIKGGIGSLFSVGKSAIASFVDGFSSIHIPMPHIGIDWNTVKLGSKSFSIPKLNLSWYAAGGFPQAGELFVANEAGPEMVGRMGNSNVVANNSQIVDGIKRGVYDATVAALSLLKTSGESNSRPIVNVYLGSRQFTDVVIEDINKQTMSTGQCPIMM